MKIETLKSTNYSRGTHQVRVLVQAGSVLQATNALVGKEQLHIYADNEGEDKEVEVIEGYSYLVSISEVSAGLFEVVLTDEAPTPQSVKDKLVAAIHEYDASPAVNSFFLANKQMWLDKATRVGLANSISIERAAGKETTTLWFDAHQYEIPIDVALQMLSALELYALDCYNITQAHIATVRLLDNVETLEGYDYTAGYPERLTFNI